MNRLDNDTRKRIVHALVEGNSIRATCRMTGAAKGTVLKLLGNLGRICAEYQYNNLRAPARPCSSESTMIAFVLVLACGGLSHVLSIADEESRFTDGPVSRVGAAGPMQVVPRYACPQGRQEGCDTVAMGVAYLGTLMRRHGLPEALCRYNAGNVCTAPARRFARAVLARARTMSAR